jgi:hypothetical protein
MVPVSTSATNPRKRGNAARMLCTLCTLCTVAPCQAGCVYFPDVFFVTFPPTACEKSHKCSRPDLATFGTYVHVERQRL